jgi:hypothetical protein
VIWAKIVQVGENEKTGGWREVSEGLIGKVEVKAVRMGHGCGFNG